MICKSYKTKRAKKNFRLSVCLDVWMYVRAWTFHVDTITFEGVSGSKQNWVGVLYVWNVGLVLKSKVISWSWSWFWTEFWFSQKLSPMNFIVKSWSSSWSWSWSEKKNSEKSLRNKTKFHEYHSHIKHNYIKINYQMISWSWSWSKFDWIEELTQIDWLERG